MRISDITEDERHEIAAWLEYSVGYTPDEVLIAFTVEAEMPGSVRLTFNRLLRNGLGKPYTINQGWDIAVEPFTIYASERLGWLQRYLTRTGRVLA